MERLLASQCVSLLRQIRRQTISGLDSEAARSSRWLALRHYHYVLAPAAPECPDIQGIVRGPIELLLQFSGSEVEGTFTDAWILESDAPNVQVLEVPVSVDVREAPISIVKARECDLETTSQCNVDEEYEPLEIIFLDGTESYDPTGLAIVDYQWEVLEGPGGLDPALLEPLGETTPILGSPRRSPEPIRSASR